MNNFTEFYKLMKSYKTKQQRKVIKPTFRSRCKVIRENNFLSTKQQRQKCLY